MTKIMSVDDSAFMRMLLIKILKNMGYTDADIIQAENGNEAVTKYKAQKPDLVFLDIVMKEKYGTEALKEIMEFDPNAKVVMCSAVGQESIMKEAMAMGAKDFIEKPFKEENVKERVLKILGTSPAGQTPKC
jgi:two-component system, chemotaxis family, chemotaxis protein CheY